jgi:hypothetical protein
MPPIRLGALLDGGIAPAVFALVERGAARHPAAAAALRGEVELRFAEGYPPVTLDWGEEEVLVFDGPASEPGVVVTSSLPDLVHLAAAPQLGGVPNPTNRRGRAALGALVGGAVRIEGSRAMGRRLLTVLALDA